MIKFIKNPEVKLNIPSFLCDNNAVGEHLNDHPVTQLLNVFGFLCVIGRPGSEMTQSILKFIKNASSRFNINAIKCYILIDN